MTKQELEELVANYEKRGLEIRALKEELKETKKDLEHLQRVRQGGAEESARLKGYIDRVREVEGDQRVPETTYHYPGENRPFNFT